MGHNQERLCRRAMLKKSTVLFASLAAIPLIVATTPARAAKMAKDVFHYQDFPKDGKKCLDCAVYTGEGACKVVEGPISPNGYCIAFSAK